MNARFEDADPDENADQDIGRDAQDPEAVESEERRRP
jgi:hypothetical protein